MYTILIGGGGGGSKNRILGRTREFVFKELENNVTQ